MSTECDPMRDPAARRPHFLRCFGAGIGAGGAHADFVFCCAVVPDPGLVVATGPFRRALPGE